MKDLKTAKDRLGNIKKADHSHSLVRVFRNELHEAEKRGEMNRTLSKSRALRNKMK